MSTVSPKLCLVPFQVMEVDNKVILKRGALKIMIGGSQCMQVLQSIMDTLSKDGATKEEICKLFSAPDRPAVNDLLDSLIKRGLLIPVSNQIPDMKNKETESDVFYWHFGEKTSEVTNRLNSKQICIMGVNNISKQMIQSLTNSGMKNIQVIDYPILRSNNSTSKEWEAFSQYVVNFKDWEENMKFKKMDLLVATSDFGGFDFMRKWNEFCVESNIPFLPVILRNLIGYVGPLVIPGDTACFECFLNRRNANRDDSEIKSISEKLELNEDRVIGYHPTMASILGDIAALELVKFFGEWIRFDVGKLIKVNLIATGLETHKILKIPRCLVCSPLNKKSNIRLTKRLPFKSR